MDIRRLQLVLGWRCQFLLSALDSTLIFDQEQAATDDHKGLQQGIHLDEMPLRHLTFHLCPTDMEKITFLEAGLVTHSS